MTDADEQAIPAILAASVDDWVMLHEVLWHATHDQRTPAAKEKAVRVLRHLFEEDLMIPGDLGETGFEDWTGTPDEWLRDALAALDKLGWKPMGAGFWLRPTEHGERTAQDRPQHRKDLHMSTDELLATFPSDQPPAAVPAPVWRDVASQLGEMLPSDYVELVESYGPGSFDDFLWVFQPESSRQAIDLVSQARTQLQALRDLQAGGEPIPYNVAEGESELLPWAVTDSGDTCYWVMRPGKSPDDWTVVVNESRGPTWEEFSGGVSEFLLAVLTGRHRSSVFPEDFPSPDPHFSSLQS